ncbi:hypothetical protein C8Q70DRAFT_456482 [Cubamyces menziesii]|nr:hypothetical protein C8Q70DRAFT_456482 [Cubamyces menziesii]
MSRMDDAESADEPTSDADDEPEWNTDDDPVRCYIGGCDSTVLRKDCREHIKQHHILELGPTGPGARPCQWAGCETSASDYNVMERHIQAVHFRYEPYVCEICRRRFARKDALKRHERSLTCRTT